jgi:hypothetical protein
MGSSLWSTVVSMVIVLRDVWESKKQSIDQTEKQKIMYFTYFTLLVL